MKYSAELLEVWYTYRDISAYMHWLRKMNTTGLLTLNEEDFLKIEELDEMRQFTIDELCKEYNEFEKEKVRKDLYEFKESEKEFAAECRIRFLKNEIDNLSEKILEIEKINQRMKDSNSTYLAIDFMMTYLDYYDLLKLQKKYMNELAIRQGNIENSGLSENEILNARQYPIDGILDFNPLGFAICPYHEEKTPSMSWWKKNNIAHCFGCGKNADAIQLVMDIHKKSFREAVKILNDGQLS